MMVYSVHYHHKVHNIHSLFLIPEEITLSCTLSEQHNVQSPLAQLKYLVFEVAYLLQ